ncbi:methyltransferase [Pseudokineococcus basanitobsidens]|uniref:Methyltransferase n=1 Tax=Pseudokineococcus basanitobsidens TaxID=1926649 RepID=A0ABU8RNT2_9ACTN
MQTASPDVDVPVVDPSLAASLRLDLAEVGGTGYRVDAVEELLGPVAAAALHREHSLPARRAVAEGLDRRDPLAALVGAFVLGLEVPADVLAAALPRCGLEGAAALGLLHRGPQGTASPLLELRPYEAVDAVGPAHWWVASDLGEMAAPGPLRTDHVLGIGGASTTLAGAAVRTPVRRALDLGTGCGVQALHLRRHAHEVVATDVSARALRVAALTLALDGPSEEGTVELRRGSLLEPVAGESFDLVVSNPPFVITPRRPDVPAYDYRDGGLVGDALVQQLVEGVGAVLAPGGTAQMLGNWEHRRGEPWTERVAAWLDASGLDGWVVERDLLDPAAYAETWVRDGGQPPGPQADGLVGAWLDDLASRRVEAVGLGLVVLRRPLDDARPRLRRLEQQPGPVAGPLGGHVADVLAAEEALASLPDDALATRRLRVAGDVTEERHARPGAEHPEVVLLRQGGGFGRVVRVGTATAGVVGACDGQLPLGVLVGAVAALLDRPAEDVAAEVVPVVRHLVADGLLLIGGRA